jgi:cell wall-associated NlpC family hydrolase
MFDRYVGIPYADRGRDFAGCDCGGLLWLVFREHVGIELPSYDERYLTGADRAAMDALISGEIGDWREVERGSERRFDGVLMREGRSVCHIGLVTDPGRLLHVGSGVGSSVIERYGDGSMLKHRIVGFYRHKNLIS